MADIGVGHKSYVGVGKETTWGTAVSPTIFLEFLDESIEKNIEPIKSGALVGDRFNKSLLLSGSIDIAGDFSIEVNPDNIGLLLGATLGAETTTQVGATTAYDHVFTPAAAIIPLSVEVGRDIASASDKAFRYSGCAINTLALSCELNSILKATFGILGKDESEETAASPTYSSRLPYIYQMGKIGRAHV